MHNLIMQEPEKDKIASGLSCFKLALRHQLLVRLVVLGDEFFRSGPLEITRLGESGFANRSPSSPLIPAYRSRNQDDRTFSSQDQIKDIIKQKLKDRKEKQWIGKLLKKTCEGERMRRKAG
jgi:hypothetical protein